MFRTRRWPLTPTSLLLLAALASCGGQVVEGDAGSVPVSDAGVTAGLTLIASIPSAGAVGVPVGSSLLLQFSAPVSAASLVVNVTPSAALGAPSFGADNTEVVYPSMSLTPGATYTVTVSATDTRGLALAGTSTFTFVTVAQTDTTAPTLVSSSPLAGAMNVATAQVISFTFSERMNDGSLSLSIQPSVDLGTPTWSAAGDKVTFSAPAGMLAAATDYSLELAATDLAGNRLAATVLNFSTASVADTMAPVVNTSAPSAAAVGVPMNTAISFSFSEPMARPATDAAFSIAPAVTGTLTWDATGSLRTFQPSAALAPNTQYTVTLGVGARDLAGNALAAPFTFSFTTGSVADVTPPTVVSTTPGVGATGVNRSPLISVTFSEPMDKASAQAAFDITIPATNLGSFSWSADGKTMTYDRLGTFAHGSAVAWRVTTAAKDLAGNALSAQLSRGFLVLKQGIAVIDAVSNGRVTNVGSVSSSNVVTVGDLGNNQATRGFFTFDLSALPETLVSITAAQFYVHLASVVGSPVTTLGGSPLLERVDYGASLNDTDYDLMPLGGLNGSIAISPTPVLGWKTTALVWTGVATDWTNRVSRASRSQFRIRFPLQSSFNDANDAFFFSSVVNAGTSCARPNPAATGGSCKPHLVVTYEYP